MLKKSMLLALAAFLLYTRTYTEDVKTKIYDKDDNLRYTVSTPVEKSYYVPPCDLQTLNAAVGFEVYETKYFRLVGKYSESRYAESENLSQIKVYEKIKCL